MRTGCRKDNQKNRFLQDRTPDETRKLYRSSWYPEPRHHHVGLDGGDSRQTTDTLGASDMAVVEFRKLMVDAAKTMEAGGEAIGSKSVLKHTQIKSQ